MNNASSTQTAPQLAKVRLLIGAVAILAMTILAYLPALSNKFIWDDDDYVTGNQTLRSLHGLRAIWLDIHALPQYYPMVHSTYWVEYHLWGLHPLGFHLVNILLHGLSAVLLWHLLERLGFARGGIAARKPLWRPDAAWFAASIFAVHPVTVESVAWVTERKNVLMLLFYLLSLWAYLHFESLIDPEYGPENPSTGMACRRWGWYVASLFLFIAAMLSKTVAATFPLGVLILIWWKRGRVSWGQLVPLVPYFLVGLPLGLVTAWLEKTRVGAEGFDWMLSPAQRLLIAGRVLWFYAGKVAWPVRLSFIYLRWDVDPHQYWQWLFPIGALVVGLALWLARARLGRGAAAAVAFFGVTLAPALGFVNIYPMRFSFVADHFQYVACIGLIVLAVGTAWCCLSRLGPGRIGWVWIGGSVILLALGGRTFYRTFDYYDYETIWSRTIQTNPRAFIAYNNLGLIRRGQGRINEAITLYNQAIDINPRYHEAHNNLAVLLWGRGDKSGAIAHLRQALMANPNYADAHANLGLMLKDEGRLDEAAAECRAAVRANPDQAKAYHVLGLILLAQNRGGDALGALGSAVTIDPGDAAAHHDLGWALMVAGRFDAGIDEFTQAVRLKPSDAGFRADLARAAATRKQAGH